jgi:CBS domain containing-hemolysin-like protein
MIPPYDPRWLCVALPLLIIAMYVAVSRQVLQVFSRKLLFEIAPAEKHEAIDRYLEKEDEYTASLRTLDQCLRLGLVLSLAFGWFSGLAATWAEMTFREAIASFLLAACLILILFLLFLEILPGIIARVGPEARLLKRLRVIDFLHRLVLPLRSVATGLVRWGVALLGGEAERPTADILEEEILTAAEEGERGGLLGSRDIDMIESIITFGNVEVSEVMTPRTEMVCLDVDDPLEVNIQRAIDCGHSRIPVFNESKDNILGLLYVKDLLRYWDRKDSIVLKDLLRKPHFVPLTKKIGELFQEFKTQRFHIAIILDEFGGTSGLITIEDIIEEIVGEITDEYEKIDKPPIKRVSANVVELEGNLHIDDMNDQLGLAIPEGDNYDTVGGFLFSQMGKIPAVGEVFDFDSISFEVTAADERRIRRLRVRLPEKEKNEKEVPRNPHPMH